MMAGIIEAISFDGNINQARGTEPSRQLFAQGYTYLCPHLTSFVRRGNYGSFDHQSRSTEAEASRLTPQNQRPPTNKPKAQGL